MIDGRLIRKMIRCDIPYDIQLVAIHDKNITSDYLNKFCDSMLKVKKAYRVLVYGLRGYLPEVK